MKNSAEDDDLIETFSQGTVIDLFVKSEYNNDIKNKNNLEDERVR